MKTSKGSVAFGSLSVACSGVAPPRIGVCSTARSSSRTRRQTVDGSPSVSRTRRWEAYTGITRPCEPRMP
ncbi:hypothetical protein SALBM135S_08808 [Streptomyces alboniger]